jgi:hypothetical protein
VRKNVSLGSYVFLVPRPRRPRRPLGPRRPRHPGPPVSRALLLRAALAVGAGLALVALGGGAALPLSEPRVVALVVAFPMLYLLCVAVHELGHVGAAVLVGFRPLLFVVGPLRVQRNGARLEPGLNRSTALSGGLVVCAPLGSHDLRRRTLVMAAGGPVASLMFGAQCLAFWMALAALPRAVDGPVANLLHVTLAFLGIGSLILGLLTLLPTRVGGFYSDGARMLRLMRSGEETEREVALLTLTGLSLGGMRPRDWDAALVQRSAAIRDGGAFEVGGLQFAYAHALDSGDIAAARTHLHAVLERVRQLPAAGRASVHLSAATFCALFDGDAAQARAHLARAGIHGALSARHQRRLAEAALLLAEGDATAAAAAAREAQIQAGRAIDRGGAALDDALAARIISGSAAPRSRE